MYINEEKNTLATKILYLATFLPVQVATRQPGKKFSLEHCACYAENGCNVNAEVMHETATCNQTFHGSSFHSSSIYKHVIWSL